MNMTTSVDNAADRFGQRVTARLDEGMAELPYDITERLRAARAQALAKRKVVSTVRRPVAAPSVVRLGNSLALGGGSDQGHWWSALIAAIPLVALAVGLVVINVGQDERGASEIAEVDAALLTDDLPPQAYADPGFAQYLKTAAVAR